MRMSSLSARAARLGGALCLLAWEYGGNGKWKKEEDFWSVKGREVAMKAYEEACRTHDPDHARKHTRLDWGRGPEWTRGGRSYAERLRVR